MSNLDLHFHSNLSDGKMNINKLGKTLKSNKIKYCSLTDHDTVAGITRLQTMLKKMDILLIPGVEITALYKKNEIHLLVYDFNIKEMKKILNERDKEITKQRKIEMVQAKKLFNKQGIKISPNLRPSKKRPVGYTIANDILKHPENKKMFIRNFQKILTIEDIYYKYQAPGKKCSTKRSGITIEWILKKLKNKTADIILAHPFLQVSVAAQPLHKNDILSLIKKGITGLEIYHNKTSQEHIDWMKQIVEEKNLHHTGGSDYHGHSKDTPIGYYGKKKRIPNFQLSNYNSL